MLGPLKKKKIVSSIWSKWCDTVYMRVHSENWPQRSYSVCLSPSVCGLFLSASHTRGMSTLISLFVCSHSCGSCAGFNQGKDMVYYATAYRFFHPWRAASALNRSERERETDRQSEREKIREQHTLFHKVWLTNWIPWLKLELQTSVSTVTLRTHGWTEMCVHAHVCALLNNTGNYNCQRESRWLGVCKRIRNKCQTCSFGLVDFSANAPVAAAALHRNASSNSHKCTQSPVKNKWP